MLPLRCKQSIYTSRDLVLVLHLLSLSPIHDTHRNKSRRLSRLQSQLGEPFTTNFYFRPERNLGRVTESGSVGPGRNVGGSRRGSIYSNNNSDLSEGRFGKIHHLALFTDSHLHIDRVNKKFCSGCSIHIIP